MMIKLQSTDSERLGKEGGSRENAWSSLSRQNGKNFAEGLQAVGKWTGGSDEAGRERG